ncbi:MAG: hypothetical protein M3R64_12085 [Pseudomonadota bacterium]|nr:hypothetical protein [Pseudomonadota bacterium]
MRNLVLMLSAVSLAIPATMAVPTSKAEARHRHYSSRSYHHTKRCRYSSGTTGLVAGGVGGALVGRSIVGHGLLGTAAGAVGGAFAGRAIDRTITAKKRCR